MAAVSALFIAPATASADNDCSTIWRGDPCGIVYNRTSGTLELLRNSAARFSCKIPRRPQYRDLPSGHNSNRYGSPRWRDTDCFRSRTRRVFTNGRWYRPGEWIRVWTSKWVYGR